MLNVKPKDTLIDQSFKLVPDQGKLYYDCGRYNRL